MPQTDLILFHSLTITTLFLVFFAFSFTYYITSFWSIILKLNVKKALISFFIKSNKNEFFTQPNSKTKSFSKTFTRRKNININVGSQHQAAWNLSTASISVAEILKDDLNCLLGIAVIFFFLIFSLYYTKPFWSPYYQLFKVLKKKTMMNFVKNENKQQEIFLLFWLICVFFLIGFILNFDTDLCMATFCLVIFLLGVLSLILILMNLFKALPDFLKILALSIPICGLFYNNYPAYAFFGCLMLFRSLTKKEEDDKKLPEAYKDTDTFWQQFKKGLNIIEYHSKKEFPLFEGVKKFGLLLAVFCVKFYQMGYYNSLPVLFIWNQEVCNRAVLMMGFLYALTTLLSVFIQFTIINHCNPIITGASGHKILASVAAGGSVVFGAGGLHLIFLSNDIDSPQIFGAAAYQRYTLGYSSDTARGLKAASDFRYEFGILPPLFEDKTLNLDETGKCLRKLEVLKNENNLILENGFKSDVRKQLEVTKGMRNGVLAAEEDFEMDPSSKLTKYDPTKK